MKARLLRKILNDTGYNISNHKSYIAIGSAYCHDLIKVNKNDFEVTYALDTFHEGRKAIKHEELEFIWDKLHEIIKTGEINDIINGKDIVENPLPVFTVVDGKLIESVTDKYGWPNTDDDGICMYENTHFPIAKQALEYGIKEYEASVRFYNTLISETEEKLTKQKLNLEKEQNYIIDLKEKLKNL